VMVGQTWRRMEKPEVFLPTTFKKYRFGWVALSAGILSFEAWYNDPADDGIEAMVAIGT
jgi:hypothetical protein